MDLRARWNQLASDLNLTLGFLSCWSWNVSDWPGVCVDDRSVKKLMFGLMNNLTSPFKVKHRQFFFQTF